MKKDLGNSGYLKSIATLMSGAMVGQLFTMICSPILTRMCSPDTLGIYSLVTGAITMFGAVMSLRYDVNIVSEPDDEKVFPLIKLSFIICVLISIMISIGYLCYFNTVETDENVLILAFVTGLLVFLMGVINIVTSYNNRQKDYKLITKTYVVRVFAQNICNLIAAFCGLGAMGLSFSQFVGYMFGVRGQAKPILQQKKKIIDVSNSELKLVAVENFKQASISAPATLANGLSYSLINYFMEALFSTAVVGYYSISYRLLGLPITIISGNVSKVFLEKASKEYQQKSNFTEAYKYTIKLLGLIALPMGGALYVFSPWACEIFFGSGWGVAGNYVRILTPMYMLRFIAGGVNCSAIIVNRQQYDLFIQVLLTISAITVFLMARLFELEVSQFLTVINIVFSLVYVIYIVLFWKCAQGEK